MDSKQELSSWYDCVGKGWHGLVQAALLVLAAAGYEPTQIKEKFGLLRIYFARKHDNTSLVLENVYRVLEALESLSGFVCEQCGCNDGTVSTKSSEGGYWILTLCDKCRLQTMNKKAK